MTTTEIVVDGLAFTECPRWRPDGLWFSDQHLGQILRIGPNKTAEVMATVPGGPSGLGWLPDGTLLAVSMHDKKLLQIAFGAPGSAPAGEGAVVTVVADLEPFHPGLSNDMVIDAQGRCYIGNIGFDIYAGEELRSTVLVFVEPRLGSTGRTTPLAQPRVVADELFVPNGSVITPAGDRFIVAESMAHRLTSFRIAADGGLDDRRLFADLDGETPDGICLDAEGGIWYASIGKHEVVRVEDGGHVTDRVSTGAREAIACMLGGDDRRDLYVCTTGTFDPRESVAAASGAVEVARVEVAGAGLP